MSRVYYPQARAILQIVFDGFGPTARDTPPKIIPIMPKAATIIGNAYNQADSWNLTFDADDLPIDPQMVRAGSVEIYLFTTDRIGDDQALINKQFNSLDQRDGVGGRSPVDTVLGELGAPSAVDRFTFNNDPMIAGIFDDHGVEYSSGGRWVTISGQDYTALLMAKQWPPLPNGRARKIPVGRQLDVILREILSEADDTGRLALRIENVFVGDIPKVQAQMRSQKRGIAVEQDTNYWDVMYKLAIRSGFILFVRGLDVVLTKPKNLGDDRDRRIRRMVWGKNLESLNMDRHLGKETAPAIVIKAYDPSLRQPIAVDFPVGHWAKVKSKSRRSKKTGQITSTSIKKTDEYQVIPVHGITDRRILQSMAEGLYHQLGRAERTVTFSTRDLTDFSANELDLLNLSAGDAVSIEFDAWNMSRDLMQNENISHGAKVQHLVGRGFGEAIAEVIAAKYDELRALKRPLRVREVTYDYDVDNGITIEAQLIDFIVPDGARDAAQKTSRKNAKRTRLDGSKLGLSDAKERALKGQHG